MLKVVIADDEIRVCRLVQMLAPWDKLGMEVVGIAANGLEALDLIEQLLPDILITDIRMPGCDGLELIQRAKSLSPQLEIIIISGYAQFEYAQTAISHGVGGYLLKPIKKQALIATLEKLAIRCRERVDSATSMEQILNRSHDIQWHRLAEDLLNGTLSLLTRERLTEEYDFPMTGDCMQAFIIKMDCAPEKLEDAPLFIVQKKIEEIFESTILPLCSLGFLYFQRFAGYGILNFDRKINEDIRQALRNCLNQMQAHNSFFGPMEISLAVGGLTEAAENLQVSMFEAQTALAERLVEGNRRLLESVPPISQLHLQPLLKKYNQMISYAVDTLSTDEANKAVDELISAVEQVDRVRGCELMELVLTAGRMFSLLIHLGEETTLSGQFEDYCDVCGSATQLFSCLRQFQTKSIEHVYERHENEAIRPIRIAKQYIRQHFQEAITLEDVCAATGFSVSYFSTMFKKETGEGFSKYLTRLRMEEAKTLLQDSNLSVAEICERVGYTDLKHFTATFKKATSLNPGQYRRLRG